MSNNIFKRSIRWLIKLIRKNFQCRFGTHWNVKYDSGLPNDIGRAGVCLDCNHKFEAIKWPRI